jgi:hypothetical protein
MVVNIRILYFVLSINPIFEGGGKPLKIDKK